jgi:ketosteroid isomerase-like protein
VPSNIDLVRSLYASFAAGDLAGFLSRLDPEVRWNEAESFPYSDRNPYVGPDAIVGGVFARLGEDWDGFRVEPVEFAGSGDVVTMFGRYRARHKKTGKDLDAQVAHTWWIRDGRVVRFQQMVDTARVLRTVS